MSVPQELSVAKLIRACGGIDGRVKLQKIVYLLEAMGYGFPYRDFRIQHYGPFSPKLAAAMDFLVNAGVVGEEKVNVGGESPRYDYVVDPRWDDFIDSGVSVANPPKDADLSAVGKTLREADRSILEIAATMCFLTREEGLSGKKLEDELSVLKGHLAPFDSNVRDARKLLAKIDIKVA